MISARRTTALLLHDQRRHHALWDDHDDDDTDDDEEWEDDTKGGSRGRRIDLKSSTQRLLNARRMMKHAGARGVKAEHVMRKMERSRTKLPDKFEQEFVTKVLTSVPIMTKSSSILRSYEQQCVDCTANLCNLQGNLRTSIGGQGASPFASTLIQAVCDEWQSRSLAMAASFLHEVKVTVAKSCWQDAVRPALEETALQKEKLSALEKKFHDVRSEYLKEVSALREQVRVRGDPERFLEGVMEVRNHFEPTHTLSPAELDYTQQVVQEKIKMIFEANPTVSNVVDFGQLERLQELFTCQEIEKLQRKLGQKLTEIKELKKIIDTAGLRSAAPDVVVDRIVDEKAERALQAMEAELSDLRHKHREDELNLRKKQNLIESLKEDQLRAEQDIDQYRMDQVHMQEELAASRTQIHQLQEQEAEAAQSSPASSPSRKKKKVAPFSDAAPDDFGGDLTLTEPPGVPVMKANLENEEHDTDVSDLEVAVQALKTGMEDEIGRLQDEIENAGAGSVQSIVDAEERMFNMQKEHMSAEVALVMKQMEDNLNRTELSSSQALGEAQSLLSVMSKKLQKTAAENMHLLEMLSSVNSKMRHTTVTLETMPELKQNKTLQNCIQSLKDVSKKNLSGVFKRLYKDAERRKSKGPKRSKVGSLLPKSHVTPATSTEPAPEPSTSLEDYPGDDLSRMSVKVQAASCPEEDVPAAVAASAADSDAAAPSSENQAARTSPVTARDDCASPTLLEVPGSSSTGMRQRFGVRKAGTTADMLLASQQNADSESEMSFGHALTMPLSQTGQKSPRCRTPNGRPNKLPKAGNWRKQEPKENVNLMAMGTNLSDPSPKSAATGPPATPRGRKAMRLQESKTLQSESSPKGAVSATLPELPSSRENGASGPSSARTPKSRGQTLPSLNSGVLHAV